MSLQRGHAPQLRTLVPITTFCDCDSTHVCLVTLMEAPARRVSGLQRQVLAFYRTVLRQTRKQPAAQRGPIAAYARGEFERLSLPTVRHRDVNPKDYQLIEHLVRKGKRQLDMLEQSSVTGIQFRMGH